MSYTTKARRRALALFERRRFLRFAAALGRRAPGAGDDRRLRDDRRFDLVDGADEAQVPSER
jgi:hypothetical protein